MPKPATKAQNGTTGSAEELAQALKATGNTHFSAKRFEQALRTYSEVVDKYSDKAASETVRTVVCNRAACYLELSQYQRCVNDCQQVISTAPEPSTPTSAKLTCKAHLRLARVYKGLGDFAKALEALEGYRKDGEGSAEDEKKLREEIVAEQRMKERKTNGDDRGELRYKRQHPYSQPPPPRACSSKPSPPLASPLKPSGPKTIPIDYMVLVEDDKYNFTEEVLESLCVAHPPVEDSQNLLMQFFYKHHHELIRKCTGRWRRVECRMPATSQLRHSPLSHLHVQPPRVVDLAQPLCVSGGPCDLAAKKFIEDEMRDSWT
ncbi:hypothetical protein JAAARDRAFT_43090 [Jaapia argillacea MUCL 33604]|uniref:Uncharacterized protein n=1 Tax=Jaapia argillacea MUCL 33604 TaxID=933084 RepID=A0A067P5J6_9AGAM|nr:hypothetical protein JAAARDRAFT_43103 [Jaapia argillacea MUCL 33604]KDQ49139.1 hypothetical protein JAAARDRAFT_43090 [Jaapia argillacea MUCL 33604]